VSEAPSLDLLALDEALSRLAETEPAKAELVKLRFFAGLTTAYYADLAPGGVIVLVAAGSFVLAQAGRTLTDRVR